MNIHRFILMTMPIVFGSADQRLLNALPGEPLPWFLLLIAAFLLAQHSELRTRTQKEVLRWQALENENQERLRDTEALLHLLSHDLAGPLFVIQSMAELQSEKIQLDPKAQQSFGKISQVAKSAQSILKVVKELEAIEVGKIDLLLKPVPLRASLQSTLDILKPLATGKNVEIHLQNDVPPELKVLGERTVLEHTIFHNVLANAIKFSQAGDRIEIRVAGQEADLVTIHIKDQGVGIPTTLIPQLFSHNGKTSRRGTSGEKGTGLGLPLARRYVQKFGGTIAVASQAREEHPDDHWTEFTVTLKKAS
jgi:signal transduction histidine kinase